MKSLLLREEMALSTSTIICLFSLRLCTNDEYLVALEVVKACFSFERSMIAIAIAPDQAFDISVVLLSMLFVIFQ